jgi:uroporphyrinogen decarboxylase
MSKEMTSRERVATALNHQEPDRVPLVLLGSYYMLNDETYLNLLEHLGMGEPLPPFRRFKSRNSNHYDDRVLDRLGTDVRYVWSGFTDLGGARMEGDCRDAWGVKWQRQGPNVTSTGFPLAEAAVEDIADYGWPDAADYIDVDLIVSRISMLKKVYPTHAIGARAVNSYGPFEQASELRGRTELLMDTVAEPDLAQLLIDKCTDVIIRGQEVYLDLVGHDIDFIEIPGDDYGANRSLLISPDTFRRMLKPALRRIVNSVKDFRPDLPVVFHSDGAIAEIIPDLIDVGIDVLNPLEPLPATDWAAIKTEYGDRLCFMGGIDIREAMTGPVDGVVEEVKTRLGIFAPGGGYLLTSANHLQVDVPPENIVALFDAGKKYGRYPLGGS